jgi:hypothetical protein
MAALIAVAILIAAALLSKRLRQPPDDHTLSVDAILATAAAKLRAANVVVEFPNAARR